MDDLAFFGSSVHVRSVLFQLLSECNYTCTHCSQDAPHVSVQSMQPIPVKIVFERLDSLRRAGAERVRFTGGEPLLHPDLDEICAYSASLGFNVSIVTNGALLSPHCDALTDAGVRSVWISLYGPNSDEYARVAGRAPPITSIVKAIRKLVARDVRVGLYCTIHLDELGDDFFLLDEAVSAGASRVKFMQFMEQGRRYSITPEPVGTDSCVNGLAAIRRFASRHPKLRVQASVRTGQGTLFRSEGWSLPNNRGCTAGEPDSWALPVSGHVKPCCLMLTDGNINQGQTEASPRERKSQLIRFSGQGIRPLANSKALCPALPDYTTAEPTEFICPLVYAQIEAIGAYRAG